MSRKIETIYEPHKKKYRTTIKTKDENGKEWCMHARHKEETPSREILYELNDKLGAAVRESNTKD